MPSQGPTPLHLASTRGFAEIADMLLEFGANPNSKACFDWRPLHEAAYGGWAECTRVLLRRGADMNAVDTVERTPLHWAAVCGYLDVLQVLLDAGADANAPDKSGFTPLHLAVPGVWGECRLQVRSNYRTDDPADFMGCLKALVSAGGDVNARNAAGKTALLLAAETGERRTILLLRELGADISVTCTLGENALHYACRSANPATIECVLDTGAFDVHSRSDIGSTPLHLSASHWRTVECMEALVRRGADVHARDSRGLTPLHLAAFHSRPEGISALLRLGADIAARADDGKTPLHYAASTSVSCVQALLRRGAPVDACDAEGRTPLFEAVSKYWLASSVRLLLESGASRTAVDHAGLTPLDLADPDILRFLSVWAVGG